MSSEFEQFRLAVLRDEALQERLRVFHERSSFVDEVVRLGVELGYELSSAEVEKEMQAARRRWTER